MIYIINYFGIIIIIIIIFVICSSFYTEELGEKSYCAPTQDNVFTINVNVRTLNYFASPNSPLDSTGL